MRYQRAELPLKLDGLEAARDFFAGCFADADPGAKACGLRMSMSRRDCVHLSRHRGDESGAAFPLRAIIADAAVHGSAGIVLAHNHPSGDPRPSDSDCRATRRLATAAEALDCTVLDHLGVRRRRVHSFGRLGLL